jgi:hypothetical protein
MRVTYSPVPSSKRGSTSSQQSAFPARPKLTPHYNPKMGAVHESASPGRLYISIRKGMGIFYNVTTICYDMTV